MRKSYPHIIIWELEIYIPDLEDALERYVMAGERIPKEWVVEYNELCKESLTTT